MTGTLLKKSNVWVKHFGMVKICDYVLLDRFQMFQGVKSGTVVLENKIFFMLNFYLKYKVTEAKKMF